MRFALVSLLAFLRVSTNPAVFRRPLGARDAIELVTSWLHVRVAGLAEPTTGAGRSSKIWLDAAKLAGRS